MHNDPNDLWLLDVRIRQRNVKKGLIDQKDVDKHVAALVDTSTQADTVTLAQPAIAGSEETNDET